ncbi:MAG: transglutaminase domain-containing protein [Myxococcales bacterium]|nr:transglutaminase domain-containing protein [Myxococcales bacterium]MCB9541527.1 transglutaminase domain-containing protein [Myxococcales bacterium]
MNETADEIRRDPSEATDESWALAIAKAAVLGAATLLLTWPLAGAVAIGAGVTATIVAVFAARFAAAAGLRTVVGVAAGLAIAGLASPAAGFIADGVLAIGSRETLIAADATRIAGLAFGLVFAVRLLAARNRTWSIVEAAAVVAAVAHLFARHRELMISRPRWLSDWALTQGLDPQVPLQAFGVLAAAAAVMLALRRQRPLKLALTLLLLLGLGAAVYHLLEDSRIDAQVEPTAGLTGEDRDGDGKPDDEQSGGGASSGLGDGSGGAPPPPPLPVAVALFHADHEPDGGLYYFRQQVLSRFDGTRLSADPGGFDDDVITRFPVDGPIQAGAAQEPAFHKRVPTTMFLLVDHPQPLALTASVEVAPHKNPAPRRFVAAYEAVSLVPTADVSRLLGHGSIAEDWPPEKTAHYLAHPEDPRYAALADEIVRDVDPRFAGDPIAEAFAIRRYLEQNGFYTRKERHLGDDPTGSFLFGSLRGYCVHFAHAAANLFRSRGIAARVAVGYAVDAQMRGSGSAVLILGDRAHAWPEIHVAGVGWIPFDVYPEQSDEPPPRFVDQSLESLLGELARDDPTGGRAPDPETRFAIPWATMGHALLGALSVMLLLGYAVKFGRLLVPVMRPSPRFAFAATLDRLSDVGIARQRGETRERYAERVAGLTPSLAALTTVHLRQSLGRPGPGDADAIDDLARRVRREVGRALPGWKRALGWLNPWGWWFTR